MSAFKIFISFSGADDSTHQSSNPNIISQDTVWHVMAKSFGYFKFEPYSIQMIDTMIYSTHFYPRALAAYVLGRGEIADTLRCLELMVSALQNEINNPIDNGPLWGFGRPFTDVIKDQYVGNILCLLKNGNVNLLKSYIENSQGQLRDLLIIIYGYSGGLDMRDKIRDLFNENQDCYLRLLALRVMNEYPDSSDIPNLEKAINDFYRSEFDGCPDNRAFLGVAKGTLSKLGFSIEEIEEVREIEKR